MRVRVKICGVTCPAAVEAAVAAGADALGFVFTPSPRRLELDRAVELGARLPRFVARVAVLHEPSTELLGAVCRDFRPDAVQCEPGPDVERLDLPVLPVFHDHPGLVDEVDRYLARKPTPLIHLEGAGRGGRGVALDRRRAARVAERVPTVLAGGLDPENVGTAIRQVRPWAVDVSSGVESAPGRKDFERIRSFIDAVRVAETRQRTPQEIS